MPGTKSEPAVNIRVSSFDLYVLYLLPRPILSFIPLTPTQRVEKERGFEPAPGVLVNRGRYMASKDGHN